VVAVDLFCGAGGLSRGLVDAGLSVVAGYDLDPACRHPYEAGCGATFCHSDIGDLRGEDLATHWPAGSVRVLVGCAPCQPFSYYMQGRKAKRDDDRWRLLGQFGRLVEACRPDIVSMENVPKLQGHGVFHEFVQRLTEIGYRVSISTPDCAAYGVPQRRRRLVLLASLHGEIRLLDGASAPPTVRQAIGHLPPVAAGECHEDDPLHCARNLSPLNRERIRASTPGGTWRQWPAELRAACHERDTGQKYASVYGRMNWDAPAPTITTECHQYGSGRFGHPSQDRAITLREAALLQSFPGDYPFMAPERRVSFVSMGRLIGNAVPPGLGRAIGLSITAHLEHCRVR
jgi:DNA (cytosine-5)-methyltransferase 1